MKTHELISGFGFDTRSIYLLACRAPVYKSIIIVLRRALKTRVPYAFPISVGYIMVYPNIQDNLQLKLLNISTSSLQYSSKHFEMVTLFIT